MTERMKALKNVQMTCFAAHEANLYLDGYPEDHEALDYYIEMQKKADEATAYFEENFGPLSVKKTKGDRFQWVETPWPWEMEANT